MKKYLIITALALTSLLISSCSNVRFAFKNRKLTLAKCVSRGAPHDTINFVVKHGRILSEIMVDGKLDTVFVDTGFNGELVYIHPMSELKPDYSKVKLSSAHKVAKIYEKLDTVHYSFLWNHLGLAMNICMDLNVVCGESLCDYPLLGMEAVLPEDDWDRMNLNFSDGRITYYTKDNMNFDLTGYKPIKCKYKWVTNQLFVYPVINGVEYECLFDTGNIGFLSLKKDKKNSQKTDSDIICEGSLGISVSGVDNGGEIIIRNNEKVTLGDDSFDATVFYVNAIKYNNMGLQFISRFDWYFDKGQLYYKPRDVVNPDYQIESPYRIIATDKGIMVIMKVVDDKNTLQFGDIITSMNGDKFTSENICHYYELLNKTKDWSNLELVIIR